MSIPTSESAAPARPCGFCGREATGYATSWSMQEGEVALCHGDDDPNPTCYMRWSWGQRP